MKLASGEAGPYAIAVDDDGVYFSVRAWSLCRPTESPPAVKRVPKVGGDSALVAQTATGAFAIAVDADNVYFADDSRACEDPEHPLFTMLAVPKGGGPAIEFPPAGQLYSPTQIALDETHVYWVLGWPLLVMDSGAGVWRAPKAGGPTEPILPGVDANDVSFDVPLPVFANGLSLDTSRVYWSDTIYGLQSAPKTGGAPTTIVKGCGRSFDAIALEAGDLFVAGSGELDECPDPPCAGGFLRRVPAGGSGLTNTVWKDADLSSNGRLALSATHVYWGVWRRVVDDDGSGTVVGALLRAPKDGGPAEIVVERFVDGIATDADCVYWTDRDDGSVWRAPL